MKNTHINYIEFKAHDLEATKTFYNQCFGWKFTDYGQNYIAFDESGVQGGFEYTNEPIVNGVLVVLYHEDLEVIQKKVVAAGGKITIPTFEFPGGKRFQFADTSGNELAIWSE